MREQGKEWKGEGKRRRGAGEKRGGAGDWTRKGHEKAG